MPGLTQSSEHTGDLASYDAVRTFIRHVVIPNAKRPIDEPGHPLYMNFYKEDVLKLLQTYRPLLQVCVCVRACVRACMCVCLEMSCVAYMHAPVALRLLV